MTAEQLDQLVRQIGDELLARLESPAPTASAAAPAAAPACGCAHEPAPAREAVTAAPERLELACLPADLDDEALRARCDRAREAGLQAVWTAASRTALARRRLAGSATRVGALIGHPAGDACSSALILEAETALLLGADELDLMAPVAALRSGRLDEPFAVLRAVAAMGAPLRLTLEPSRLGKESTLTAAALARLGGASSLRVSNGALDPHGASPEAVALLRRALGDDAVLVASGGAATPQRIEALFTAGADRFAGEV